MYTIGDMHQRMHASKNNVNTECRILTLRMTTGNLKDNIICDERNPHIASRIYSEETYI